MGALYIDQYIDRELYDFAFCVFQFFLLLLRDKSRGNDYTNPLIKWKRVSKSLYVLDSNV